MNLYYVAAAQAGDRWQGTQADAKQMDKATGKRGWVLREVPTTPKEEFIKWLNSEEQSNPYTPFLEQCDAPMPTITINRQPDELEQAELRAVAEAKATTMSKQLTSDSIVEFILNDATVAQVEVVFAALGTRFKECINGTR